MADGECSQTLPLFSACSEIAQPVSASLTPSNVKVVVAGQLGFFAQPNRSAIFLSIILASALLLTSIITRRFSQNQFQFSLRNHQIHESTEVLSNTVSVKEAEELLGGWYTPLGLDVPAEEQESRTAERESYDATRDLFHVCGSWMRQYAEFHKKARNATRSGNATLYGENDRAERIKYITFRCPGLGAGQCIAGLGDTLVGLASTFLVALATNRVLLVDWAAFSSVFLPAAVDWRVDPETLPGAEGGFGLNTWQIEEMVFTNVGVRDKSHALDFFEKVDVDHIVIEWNRGIVSRTLLGGDSWAERLEARGMKPPIAFGCILRLLLRVKASVLSNVVPQLRVLSKPNTDSICIHVRIEDKESGFFPPNDTQSDANSTDGAAGQAVVEGQLWQQREEMFACAERLSDILFPTSSALKWVVVSSSLALKDEAKRRYGDKVMVTDILPQHVILAPNQTEAYQSSIAEWALFASCKKFIVTDSGFSKTAAMYSLKPDSTWILPRRKKHKRGWEKQCLPTEPASLGRLGNSWSGL